MKINFVRIGTLKYYVNTEVGSDSSASGSANEPFKTINRAMNAAFDGDTVIVYPGTYNEDVNFETKSITLGSLFLDNPLEQFINQTVIDGLITIVGVDSNSSVIGLTVKNENGDGIYINHNEHKIILSELIVRETNASAISINNSSTDLKKLELLIIMVTQMALVYM